MTHNTHSAGSGFAFAVMPAVGYAFVALSAGDFHHILFSLLAFPVAVCVVTLVSMFPWTRTTSSLPSSPSPVSFHSSYQREAGRGLVLTRHLEVPHHPLILGEGL